MAGKGKEAGTVEILVVIRDPTAVKFYKSMPDELRSSYAEVLLTGAAYLASQKDLTSESIKVLEHAASEIRGDLSEENEVATTKFLKEETPQIIEKCMKDFVEKLPNPKDFPSPEDYKKALVDLRELIPKFAEHVGMEVVAQKTTMKGLIFEEEFYPPLDKKYGSEYNIDDLRDEPGAIPRCKLGDYVLRSSHKIALDLTEETLSKSAARKKVDKALQNREADGAVLIFRNPEQMPKTKPLAMVGRKKFLAYFGKNGNGTWDIAIDLLIALIEAEKRAEESAGVDIAAQVSSYADTILQQIDELDLSLEKDVQGRAESIGSAATKICDATRSIRADKLSSIKSLASMLVTIAKGQPTLELGEAKAAEAAS